MIRSISKLFTQPVYSTLEEAMAAGHNPSAPYDQTKPVKCWLDPNPPTPDEYGDVQYLMIACTKNGCGETPLIDFKTGQPYLRNYKMPAAEARSLNIPPKSLGAPDPPQPFGEWNVPCRPLALDEELVLAFGGLPVVQRKGAGPIPSTSPLANPATPPSTVDLSRIEARLEEIEAKLDILMRR